MAHLQLRVEGMSCSHCQHAVESALLDLPGVAAATADVSSGAVDVDTTADVTPAMLREAVEEAGYQLADIAAS